MHNPLDSHWSLVKHILRYISGTFHHSLLFTKFDNLELVAYCDTDWGADLDDRQSTIGFCINFGSNLVRWGAKKQSVVSCSSIEAGHRSIAKYCC